MLLQVSFPLLFFEAANDGDDDDVNFFLRLRMMAMMM